MRIHFLFAGFLLFAANAMAQETVYTNRATELRAAPDVDAKVMQALPDKTAVQLLERKGAWSRVQIVKGTEKETGWVRMMHLRGGVVVAEAQPQSTGGGLLSGFNRLLGGNQNSNLKAQSATVGIRGLSPEDLKTAQPNGEGLRKIQAARAEKGQAEQFAKEEKLVHVDVAELQNNDRGGRK